MVVIRGVRVVLGWVRPYLGTGLGRSRTVQVMRAHPSPFARIVQVQVEPDPPSRFGQSVGGSGGGSDGRR